MSAEARLVQLRGGRVRAATVNVARLSKRERLYGLALNPEVAEWRPATRGDCAAVARPCPHVSCRHHLYLEVNERNGAVKLNFPDRDPDGLPETCSLDVADRGGATLEVLGSILNLTRERLRQLEERALLRLRAGGGYEHLRSSLGDG